MSITVGRSSLVLREAKCYGAVNCSKVRIRWQMTSVTNTQESPKVCRPMTVKELMAPNSHQSVKGIESLPVAAWLALECTMPEFCTHSSSVMTAVCSLKETTGAKGDLLHSSSF